MFIPKDTCGQISCGTVGLSDQTAVRSINLSHLLTLTWDLP